MRGAVLATSAATLTLERVTTATSGRLSGDTGARALTGVSIDSRTLAPGQLFFAIAGKRFDGHEFLAEAAAKGAAAAVVHRDLAQPAGLPLIRVADTTRALQDLARDVRASAGVPVVAITGSAGKTTTKEMTAALLETRGPVLKTEGNLNNQYGLPLTLLKLRDEHQAAVLELGMSAAGELRELSRIAAPDVAVITNVAPVHLEFFDSLDAIAAAKAEIFEGLAPGGAAVLNGDDARLSRIGAAQRGEVLWFGRDRRFDVSAENWRGTAFGMRFDLVIAGRKHDVALPLAGPHFVMNFLAAAAAAHRLGVPPEAMADAATRMKAARHRGELLRLGHGVMLLDDSYNSNPVAVCAAVVALGTAGGRRRVAFLGDMLELGPDAPAIHRRTGEAVAPGLDVVVGVGALAAQLLEAAEGKERHAFADAASAAAASAELVRPGDAVLVKGSRGVRMESIVAALVERFGQADGQS